MAVNMNQFPIPPLANVHTNHVAVQDITVLAENIPARAGVVGNSTCIHQLNS